MPDEPTRVSTDIDGAAEGGDSEGPADDGGDRPEWLPEKFDSPEEMAKSYSELESKVGAPDGDEGDDPGDTPDDVDPDDLKIQEETEGTDFDLNEVAREFAEEGEVSEETYEAFEEATGLDRSSLDSHLRGQAALAQQAVNRMAKVAGGQENLDSILSWAGQNLSEGQIESYNNALEDGRMDDAELAMRGIVQQYAESRGVEGETISGGGAEGSGSGVEPFQSSDEVTEAMSDDRYKSDPAYRARVQKRLDASDVF